MDQGETEKNEAHRAAMAALKEKQDAEVRAANKRQGVLVVNTGDGKGKSTAAFGMAIRAAGHGQRVLVMQFIKGRWSTGEHRALERFPEISWHTCGDGFTWNTQDRAADIALARGGWDQVVEAIEQCRGDSPPYQLIVLDELNIVLRYDYLPVEEVVQVLAGRPPQLNVVVTGRNAPDALVEIADTVTEMRAVKHAYKAGIKAQKGVDF